jgi:hypothetical protein
MMKLTWTPSASASALHAAESIHLHRAKLTDRRIENAIGTYAINLGNWIEQNATQDKSLFWRTLVGHAAILDSNHLLAEAVIRKSSVRLSTDTATMQLAGFLDDIEAAYNQLFPKLLEQLPIRARPLQEHWLGFGQGLLSQLGRLSEKELLVDEARIVLLQPALGGSGVSHAENNLVRVEAVLTNPLTELPEVVRLAWLVSQLNLDLPVHGDILGGSLVNRLAPLVMLPPVLAAAEVMELSKCNESLVELAIEHWHIPVPRDLDVHQTVAPTMMDWWETYLQTRPKWSVAMQAFAKMLGIL